ncbi:MAG: VWA-like domain-containing protein [Gemmataceae bacterium]|nr:VWA-like domain-containing protein [Gemmataceae bacterium]
MKETTSEREVLDRIHEGFRLVGLTFPYLVGLIDKIQVQLDGRVNTMGIFASGRLVVSPDFVRTLSTRDLMFVLAHELYHLTLRTHDRGQGTDPLRFNYAHDFIINDILRQELPCESIPAGGLDWPGARFLSAEKILGEMERHPALHHGVPQAWDILLADDQSASEQAPSQGQGPGPAGDVLDSALEKEWFPETSDQQQRDRIREVQEQAARSMSLQALMESLNGRGRGSDPGAQQHTVAALRALYRPPWELALQRWLESASPSDRSYARPSRRGADRTDVVLPGRKREGWTLHIVLDTSGSMVEEIPRALGAIGAFCEATGVALVHLIQCDAEVGGDEVLAPAEVSAWKVTGYGGSDLTPALCRLAENPDVAAAIVLTDGEITYPAEPVPYNVLWVLPAWKDPREFTPRYGKVISMTRV